MLGSSDVRKNRTTSRGTDGTNHNHARTTTQGNSSTIRIRIMPHRQGQILKVPQVQHFTKTADRTSDEPQIPVQRDMCGSAVAQRQFQMNPTARGIVEVSERQVHSWTKSQMHQCFLQRQVSPQVIPASVKVLQFQHFVATIDISIVPQGVDPRMLRDKSRRSDRCAKWWMSHPRT